ncbi:MAG: cation diffusion facilitator family transporter [Mariprofundaceae bacterium]
MSHGSEKAVLTAVAGNATVTIAKFVGFALSGSSALMAEAVHSLADTANQSLLYLGLKRSQRQADARHHFGYGQEQYFWNLVSAVTIFFVGCVYTIMHAIGQLSHGEPPELNWIPFAIIGLAFVVEGYSLMVALSEFNRQRKQEGAGFAQHFRETRDPTTLAVLIEDSVAVFGLLLALIGMSLAAYTGSSIFDGIAAIAIGLLMGLLAFFLAHTNKRYLIDAADSSLDATARGVWEEDARVQRVQRVNSIVLSPEESLLMAEVELREEALFADMSEEEIERTICYMQRINETRHALEAKVREKAPRASHIFIELVGLPEGKKQ